MSWLADHKLVFFLLAVYTGILAYHAWEASQRTRGLADYYVGGRCMGGWSIGLSFFATYSSTNSFIGFSGQAYSYGVPWLLLAPCLIVMNLLAWSWIGPRLRDFAASLDSVTIPDFIGFRFGSTPARVLAALIVLFASLLYMTAIYKGIANLLETFLGIRYGTAVLIVFVIVMLYTMVGGFISVVKTDGLQGVLLIGAAVLLFWGTAQAAGGVESFFLVRDHPRGKELFSWNGAMPISFLSGILLATTIKLLVEPRQLSRFYALQDLRSVRKGMWVSTLSISVVYAMLVPIGVYARNIFPEGIEDTDRIVPMLVSGTNFFNPVGSAFLLVAMVGAAMSSLDSVLLVMASTCQRDLMGLLKRSGSEKTAVRVTRLYVGLFALLTAAIALDPPGGIVGLTSFSGSLFAGCFFPAIVLGLHWRQGNGTAVIASFVTGLVTLLIWKYMTFFSAVHEIFPALLCSTLSYVLVALSTPCNASPEVQRLFDGHSRLRPSGRKWFQAR